MHEAQPRSSTRKRILIAITAILIPVFGIVGYVFLYFPPLDWQEHLEVFDDAWGIADPSYRNWSGKVKNIGPYPIRSAEIVLELKDASGNVTYTGRKQLVNLTDPPMHPGNVKRFSVLLKYTKAEKIDDQQTAYRIDIHTYRKPWF